MKNYWVFFGGVAFGSIISSIVAYSRAEILAATKQQIKDQNRERGYPIFWWGKWLGRLFISPQEAAYASKKDTFFQFPSKEDLAQKPGRSNDELYDSCFLKYVVYRKLTFEEAWIEAQKDSPDFLPKKLSSDYSIQLKQTKKSFIQAMRRRWDKLRRG
jgi:hypothetical protein